MVHSHKQLPGTTLFFARQQTITTSSYTILLNSSPQILSLIGGLCFEQKKKHKLMLNISEICPTSFSIQQK